MAVWKNRSEMKIVSINLAMLVSYTILVNVVILQDGTSGEEPLRVMWLLMFLIGFHTVANTLIALVLWLCKRRELADGFFLSMALVLVIGFSLCWGGLALSG